MIFKEQEQHEKVRHQPRAGIRVANIERQNQKA